jgi:transposase
MGLKRTDEFRQDAVPKDDMSLAKENDRLRREIRLLKEEREILKRPASSSRA